MKDGFTAPVTFHAYGADEYHGGSLVIPGDAVLETCVSMGGKLLEFMGAVSHGVPHTLCRLVRGAV